MSRYLSINELVPGMITAEPVLNRYGQTILGRGVVLEAEHMTRLKTWGIMHVCIKSDDESSIGDEIIKVATAWVAERCRWNPRNPQEDDMINAAIQFKAMKLAVGSNDEV